MWCARKYSELNETLNACSGLLRDNSFNFSNSEDPVLTWGGHFSPNCTTFFKRCNNVQFFYSKTKLHSRQSCSALKNIICDLQTITVAHTGAHTGALPQLMMCGANFETFHENNS